MKSKICGVCCFAIWMACMLLCELVILIAMVVSPLIDNIKIAWTPEHPDYRGGDI